MVQDKYNVQWYKCGQRVQRKVNPVERGEIGDDFIPIKIVIAKAGRKRDMGRPRECWSQLLCQIGTYNDLIDVVKMIM